MIPSLSNALQITLEREYNFNSGTTMVIMVPNYPSISMINYLLSTILVDIAKVLTFFSFFENCPTLSSRSLGTLVKLLKFDGHSDQRMTEFSFYRDRYREREYTIVA